MDILQDACVLSNNIIYDIFSRALQAAKGSIAIDIIT